MVLKEAPNFINKLHETYVIENVQVGSPEFHFIKSSQIKGKPFILEFKIFVTPKLLLLFINFIF